MLLKSVRFRGPSTITAKRACTWVKNENRLVASADLTQEILVSVLEKLWEMQLEGFELVAGVFQEQDWQPSPDAIAQFVVRGVFEEAKGVIKSTLHGERFQVKTVLVERQGYLKGVVVNREPALQITLNSPMSSTQKLAARYDPNDSKSIEGIPISCGDMRGVVRRILGRLSEYRERLKRYQPKTYDPAILDRLPDNHPIVEVQLHHRTKGYPYPLQVLDIAPDMGSLKKLGLTQAEINRVTGRFELPPKNETTS